MRVPVAWLRSYCDPGGSAAEIAAALTASGSELERIDQVGAGGGPDGLVVGRVTRVEPHPDAERLRVCRVDDGDRERTVVCGAPNVEAGQAVALALPGATLAGGVRLEATTLRGVESEGMILAEDELGLGPDHEGIIVLGDEVAPGSPLAGHLQVADEALELEISPNRPDCMGVYGIARELHAVTGAPLAEDPTLADAEPVGDEAASKRAAVAITDPSICLRFTARVFEDVEVGPSPLWLKQRLTAAGQRPISNVVDITNYVMLLTGQPLHAFDLDRVRGGRIEVRRARSGETMTTLDGVERRLDEEAALVCDGGGPVGIAGIMGGAESEVSSATTRVLMEVATWVGPNILRTSKQLGLRTEASARFERQLHPDQAIAAQRLTARLMVELCGARLLPGTLDAYPAPVTSRAVRLRSARMDSLLGDRVDPGEATAILGRLGFEVSGGPSELEVVVPPWRDADVQREADLIEEVARVRGLDRLPSRLPASRAAVGRLSEGQRLRRRLEDALRDRGLSETISYSFVSEAELARLRLEGEHVRIANPLSEDQAVMRPSLLPGLVAAVRHNAAHGRVGVALFESARVYEAAGGPDGAGNGSPRGATPARERHHLAALVTRARPGTWRSPAVAADYFAARALLDAILDTAGVERSVTAGGPPFLHPGRSATVALAGGPPLGWVGELHPQVVRAADLGVAGEEPVTAGFEIDLDALSGATADVVAYRDLIGFPAVLQDVAITVPEGVPAARLEEAVRAGGGDLLESAEVFDVYTGEQAGAGRKSVALRLGFRAPDRTLTDVEVAERRAAIEAALAPLEGRLRGRDD